MTTLQDQYYHAHFAERNVEVSSSSHLNVGKVSKFKWQTLAVWLDIHGAVWHFYFVWVIHRWVALGSRGCSVDPDHCFTKKEYRDLPDGPVVKNSPSNAGDTGSIPGRGTKIPYAAGQLSLSAATTEPTCSGAHVPQLERSPYTTMEDPVCHN